jgi:hypothetical protein
MAAKQEGKGYGCMIACCVLIFLLAMLPPLYHPSRGLLDLGQRAFMTLFIAIPLFIWYWWSSAQSQSSSEDNQGKVARGRRWLRLDFRTVWTITAVLTLASVLGIRWFADAPEDPRRVAMRNSLAQRTGEERAAIFSEYVNANEKCAREFAESKNPNQAVLEQRLAEADRRIAEKHHLTIEELHAFGDGTLQKQSTFVQRNSGELFVLYFTPLLILNTPLHRLLTVLLFGSREAYREEEREYYSVRYGERILFLRMNLCMILGIVVVFPEFWLLAQCMTR